jgi:hypothetical protein
MTTSQPTSFLSEILEGKPIPPSKLGYFRARLSNRLHELVLDTFVKREADGEITRAELARRIDRKPEQVSRWLGAPGNWTIDTASDLMLGMGCELGLFAIPLGQAQTSQAVTTQAVTTYASTVPLGPPGYNANNIFINGAQVARNPDVIETHLAIRNWVSGYIGQQSAAFTFSPSPAGSPPPQTHNPPTHSGEDQFAKNVIPLHQSRDTHRSAVPLIQFEQVGS